MRIAIYHNLGPGGALRTVSEFVRGASGHDCTVFTLDFGAHDIFQRVDPEMSKRDLSAFGEQVRVPVTRPRRWLDAEGLERLQLLRELRRAEKRVAARIDGGNYDVAYVHPCWLTQSPSILKDLRTPSLYFMHEVRRASFEPGYRVRTRPRSMAKAPGWLAEELVQRTLRRMDIEAVRAASAIVTNSNYTQTQARAAYGARTSVVHLGVDATTFRLGNGASELRQFYVVSVGGMEEVKAHHLVVAALARMPECTRPALEVVYERCDPSYLARVRDDATRMGVTMRESAGVSDARLVELYQGALATVAVAKLEPLGLVPLESLACGTPVVVGHEGGYLETTIDEVNALHVPRNPGAIADALERIRRGHLTKDREVLRSSVLPYWSLRSGIDRQLAALERASSVERDSGRRS